LLKKSPAATDWRVRLREKIAILSNTIQKMVVSIQEKVHYSAEFDRGHWDWAIGRDDNDSVVERQKPAAIEESHRCLRCYAASVNRQIRPGLCLTIDS
jgi:hypothetical protein